MILDILMYLVQTISRQEFKMPTHITFPLPHTEPCMSWYLGILAIVSNPHKPSHLFNSSSKRVSQDFPAKESVMGRCGLTLSLGFAKIESSTRGIEPTMYLGSQERSFGIKLFEDCSTSVKVFDDVENFKRAT